MKQFLLLFPLLILLSCSNSRQDKPKQPPMKTYDQITFEFRDASVPPQYHRSYTIDVTSTQSHLVVDSYGEVLADTTENVKPEVWKSLQELANGLQEGGSHTALQATGTKGYTLALYEKGNEVYKLYWDSLSGAKAGQAAKDLRSAIQATQPALSELTR